MATINSGFRVHGFPIGRNDRHAYDQWNDCPHCLALWEAMRGTSDNDTITAFGARAVNPRLRSLNVTEDK